MEVRRMLMRIQCINQAYNIPQALPHCKTKFGMRAPRKWTRSAMRWCSLMRWGLLLGSTFLLLILLDAVCRVNQRPGRAAAVYPSDSRKGDETTTIIIIFPSWP